MNEENFLHHCKVSEVSVWSFWLKTFFNFQAYFLITWNLTISIPKLSLEKGPIYWKSVSPYLCHTHLAGLRKGQGSVHGCRFLRAEVRNSQRYPTSLENKRLHSQPDFIRKFYFKAFSSLSCLEFHCNTWLIFKNKNTRTVCSCYWYETNLSWSYCSFLIKTFYSVKHES